MMKVIIAGSRDFNDYELLKRKCDKILSNSLDKEITIISGGARGADNLGEKYAKEKGYKVKIYKADWTKYGKKAGYLRNREMGENATHLIAFPMGESRGTRSMIDIAKQMKLGVRVVEVDRINNELEMISCLT